MALNLLQVTLLLYKEWIRGQQTESEADFEKVFAVIHPKHFGSLNTASQCKWGWSYVNRFERYLGGKFT